jgi:integrase
MSLAEVWGMRSQGSNPCKGISRFKEFARSRYLGREEISRLGEALRDLEAKQLITPNAANAIKLLLLTGARLNEVLCARWDWIDTERRVLMLPDSKGGARAIFLSEVAIEVLTAQRELVQRNPFIFPGSGTEGHIINLRKPWVRVCTAAGIEGVRLHDLRHTAASIAVGQGSSLAIIGRFLGHTQAQTTQRYAHVDLDPAMRAANAIGQFISDAFEPQHAK